MVISLYEREKKTPIEEVLFFFFTQYKQQEEMKSKVSVAEAGISLLALDALLATDR